MTKSTKGDHIALSADGQKMFDNAAAFYGATNPDVERVKLFGYDCLRVRGKVFAKLDRANLILKLPRSHLAALIETGRAGVYQCRGRPMREWGVMAMDHSDIVALAEEARVFVES